MYLLSLSPCLSLPPSPPPRFWHCAQSASQMRAQLVDQRNAHLSLTDRS